MKSAYRNTRFRCPQMPEPLPEAFGILTAYNPNGERQSEEVNVAASVALKEKVKEIGYTWFPVTGGSPDFSHAEPGFGIAMPSLEEARQLARDFDQEAFFWVLRGEVILVSTLSEEQESLGSWKDLLEQPGAEKP